MQEVMIGTDRLPARHLTALGGCVIGMIAGVLMACAAGWFLIEAERAESRKSADNMRAEFASAIGLFKADALQKQKRLSTAPIAYVAAISIKDSDELIEMMSKFPTFKTDPYKQLFTELGAVVKSQREQSKSLVMALGEQSSGAVNMCSIAEGSSLTPVLWSSNSTSLSADGWRGVAP